VTVPGKISNSGFCRELLTNGQGITSGQGIQWKIGNSAGNYQLMDDDSTGGLVNNSAGNYKLIDGELTGG
jgi:hypothetical protein